MFKFSPKLKQAITEQVSAALDRALPNKGDTQKMAAMAGVTPATISQWKKGAQTPTLPHLFQLSKALGIPIHVLCGYSGKRKVRSGDLVFKQAMNLSIIGAAIEKRGKMTPAARRMLKRINTLLESLVQSASAPNARKRGIHTI